jgi:uncharacterized protein YbjQ (UPF0145 family)
MLLTTTPSVEGHRITRYCGVVTNGLSEPWDAAELKRKARASQAAKSSAA